MMQSKRWAKLCIVIIFAGVVASACGTQAPEVVEKVVTKVVKETVVETVKETVVVQGTPEVVEVEVVVTATPEPSPTTEAASEEPQVGGTLRLVAAAEPGTLDGHRATTSIDRQIAGFIGGNLIARNPEGNIVPYLAESWKASEDGLTWDFTLKDGVTFHDGTPLTAEDYAWSIQRILDPETQAGAAKNLLGPVESAEALDARTLRLHLTQPYFPILYGLELGGYIQPLPQAAVKELGDQFGRQPIGVGPYKFKEWQTGEKIVLERNPDFNWGPDFAHAGPPYFENVEYRFISEYATTIAALEAGEIDMAFLEPQDVERIEATGDFQIYEYLQQGMYPALLMNVSKPPFDDIRVRKAFNMAVDKETLVKVVMLGNAVPHYGPLSPSVVGYWPDVEQYGYHYDPEQAEALLEEAGYVRGSGGIWEKDGESLSFTLRVSSASPEHVKAAQVLQEQFKALGIDIELSQEEFGVLVSDILQGQYDLTIMGITYDESDLLHIAFHSSNAGGGYNISQVKDPVLDDLLERSRTETDPNARQEVVNEAQKYVAENAYIVPLYASKIFVAVNKRIKGIIFASDTGDLFFNDAYISEN